MTIFRVSNGPSAILSTAILRRWRRVVGTRLIVVTSNPDVFRRHPDVLLIWRPQTLRRLLRLTALIPLADLRTVLMNWLNGAALRAAAPPTSPGRHAIQSMGLTLNTSPANPIGLGMPRWACRPWIRLSRRELRRQRAFTGTVIVQSNSTNSDLNLNWAKGRMQEVVDALHRREITVVHIGQTSDEPLEHVRDMRGKLTRRQTAAAMANAALFIGLQGEMMHLAASVGLRSVIIYTHHSRPDETGYPQNLNLRAPDAGDGCWQSFWCPQCHRSAEQISVDQVLEAALDLLEANRDSSPRALPRSLTPSHEIEDFGFSFDLPPGWQEDTRTPNSITLTRGRYFLFIGFRRATDPWIEFRANRPLGRFQPGGTALFFEANAPRRYLMQDGKIKEVEYGRAMPANGLRFSIWLSAALPGGNGYSNLNLPPEVIAEADQIVASIASPAG